jgi:hypothetical protein
MYESIKNLLYVIEIFFINTVIYYKESVGK